jgi:hypothetical protein
MSSSRSIASARQRRSNEPPHVVQRGPNTSINSQQQPKQNKIPQEAPKVPVGKLAIGDAFALVTIRLGRVENIIQKLEAEGFIGQNAQPHSNVMEHDENMRLVDDTVIRNVITRLADLEKYQTKLSNQPKIETGITSEDVVKIVNQKISHFENQITKLTNELRETKEMLMKVQSFSMETNQKIISIILTQQKQEENISNEENNSNIKAENEENEESEESEESKESEASEASEARLLQEEPIIEQI